VLCCDTDSPQPFAPTSYCSWPGQAVAYKIGQIAILDMKKKAREKMGSAFDIKDFHRCVSNLWPFLLSPFTISISPTRS
jgi:hypothetical protein